MLNIIKMDLYRMLKTKSMYVIWIVLAAILLITTSLCKTDYELSTEKDAMKQEQVTEPTVDNINVGMMVTLPTEPGEKVTVYDIFFANSQGKLYALLLVIFTVLFSTADISSGYIRNSDFFQGNCLGCLYGTDNGRCILISGSGEWYFFRRIGMGKYKGNFILFCD